MIKAVNREAVPYVLEEDRANPVVDQSIFWVLPKRAHEANESVKRYGGAARDGRGGFRDFNVNKLDTADVEEFVSLVQKVERYELAKDSMYRSKFKDGIVTATTEKEVLAEIASSMSSGHLTEIFDAAGDAAKLEAGRYLGKVKVENVVG